MDLPLPKFAGPADRLARPIRPWIVMTDSPASPAPARLTDPPRSPSPCFNLDALSSEESVGPGDISTVPICISDDYGTHVLSDDDLPPAVDVEDWRQVVRIRDVPPEGQEVEKSWNDQPGDTRWAVWRAERSPKTTGAASQLLVRTVDLPPVLRTGDIPPGVGTADLTTVVRADEVPPVGRMVTVQPEMPPDSVSMSPDSHQMVAFDDSAASSVPMSPNQVRVDVSQDIPDEGTVFEVSPDTSGFLMRPSGVSARTPVANCPFPPAVNPFSDPVLGDPIAFAQCAMIPGRILP